MKQSLMWKVVKWTVVKRDLPVLWHTYHGCCIGRMHQRKTAKLGPIFVCSGCEDGGIYGSTAGELGKLTNLWKDSMRADECQFKVRPGGDQKFWHIEAKDQIHHRVRDNRRINTDEISFEVSNSYGKKLFNNDSKYKQELFCLMELGNSWTIG